MKLFLIHSVKLQHKASVAAPVPAVNTNTTCGYGRCNKCVNMLNVREQTLRDNLSRMSYVGEQMILIIHS